MTNVTRITTGAITNSVFVAGDHNFVVKVDNVEAGATVNIVKPEDRPAPRPAPVVVPPKPFNGLLGRQKELATLLSASQAAETVSLWASNGMGKTALVRNLINSIHETNSSKSIVYLDAQGLGRDDLLQKLFGIFFDCPDSYVPAPATVATDLQQVKSLVFVDNLGLSGDDVVSLINTAPACSFVLISTQRALLGEGEALPLHGLPDAAAIGLFEKEFGRPLDEAEKEVVTKISELLKGCPDEIIKTADRGRDAQKTPVQLLSDLRGSGVDEQSLAALATANLSEADRKVLAFLAAAGESAVPTAILKLALPDVDVALELERLKSLNLIQSHSPRYSLSGTLPAALAAAWDLTTWRDTLLEASTNWLSEQEASETVEDALGMLLHALNDAAARKKWPEVIRLGRLLEGHVFSQKRWQAWADVLKLVLQAAQNTSDGVAEGWALHELGSRALAQGEFHAARSYLNEALKTREALHDRNGVNATRHNLDVLKAATTPSRGNGSGKNGAGGGHGLTYGFFGLTGIVLVVAAAYFVTRRTPSAPPAPVAPPASTTPARLEPSAIFTMTPTATATRLTPTSTRTETATPSPTATHQLPFPAVVTVDNLACRYGPGKPYTYEWTLSRGDEVDVLGREDTAFGPWVYVKYTPKFGRGPNLPCWVSPDGLKMSGDIAWLQPFYPDKAPLIQFESSAVAAPPAPSEVSADRDGNLVIVTWTGVDLAPGDRQCDRKSPGCPLFLAEFWTCQAGKFVFTPQSIYAEYDPSQPTISGYAQIQDEAGCSEASYGRIYLAHADGYVGPTNIPYWPLP